MHPFVKIIAFIALLAGGTLLASLSIVLLASLAGIDMSVFTGSNVENMGELPQGMLMLIFIIQSVIGFILPAIVFGRLFYRQQWRHYFNIKHTPAVTSIVFGTIALFAAYPLVQLTFEVNMLIPLPAWMTALEDNAATVLQDLLAMHSFGGFLLSLLVIAILPGIGEELVFRGVLQRQIQDWTGRPVLSVWIAAMVFSAIHMQFEGFLPRMALGALLGFVYLWSNNLWVPIAVHALNNGFQVAVLYFSGVDLSNMEEQSTMPLNVWIILVSVLVLYLCHQMILKSRNQHARQ